MEYAKLLKAYADANSDDLHILMRVYFEKLVPSSPKQREPCSFDLSA